MKSFLLSLSVFLLLAACRQEATVSTTLQNKTEQVASNFSVTNKSTLFSSTDKKTEERCAILNDTVQGLIRANIDTLKQQALQLLTDFPDTTGRPAFQYELYVTDSVYMATDALISVCVTMYQYTGGAHGMTRFYGFNYDVKRNKFLTPQEIVDYKQADKINALLAANFKNPYNCFNQKPTLDLVNVVTVSPTDVCFLYEHYVLGAYACGTVEVNVPKQEVPLLIK